VINRLKVFSWALSRARTNKALRSMIRHTTYRMDDRARSHLHWNVPPFDFRFTARERRHRCPFRARHFGGPPHLTGTGPTRLSLDRHGQSLAEDIEKETKLLIEDRSRSSSRKTEVASLYADIQFFRFYGEIGQATRVQSQCQYLQSAQAPKSAAYVSCQSRTAPPQLPGWGSKSALSPVASRVPRVLAPPHARRGRVASSALLRTCGSFGSRVSDPSHAAQEDPA